MELLLSVIITWIVVIRLGCYAVDLWKQGRQ